MSCDRWVKIPENNTGFKSISGHMADNQFLEFVTVHRTPNIDSLYNHGINYDFCVYADHMSISKMVPGRFNVKQARFDFKELK